MFPHTTFKDIKIKIGVFFYILERGVLEWIIKKYMNHIIYQL
jgi:hypothetical protein